MSRRIGAIDRISRAIHVRIDAADTERTQGSRTLKRMSPASGFADCAHVPFAR
jgi:hypothetical protein